jgi:hypothetical protein
MLSGVSCTSPSACTAAGLSASRTGAQAALAERWDGTSRTIQAAASPAGATGTSFSGVWCTSATAAVSCPRAADCIAVGQRTASDGGTAATLAERWNGTSWSVQTTPNPRGTHSAFLGVSCTSASACTGAGFSADGKLFAARWDGTAWSAQSADDPGGIDARYPGTEFGGVSCTSATACMAAGNYTIPATVVTLAEHWNGTAWSVHAPANPTGARDSELNGVWCASATDCTAVGAYHMAFGPPQTLAEHWTAPPGPSRPPPTPQAPRAPS